MEVQVSRELIFWIGAAHSFDLLLNITFWVLLYVLVVHWDRVKPKINPLTVCGLVWFMLLLLLWPSKETLTLMFIPPCG